MLVIITGSFYFFLASIFIILRLTLNIIVLLGSLSRFESVVKSVGSSGYG